MSMRRTDGETSVILYAEDKPRSADEIHWIEIFKDRVAEDLKQVLQEDMDWTTSLPILERLNQLREIEDARRNHDELRKAS